MFLVKFAVTWYMHHHVGLVKDSNMEEKFPREEGEGENGVGTSGFSNACYFNVHQQKYRRRATKLVVA